MHSYKNQDAQTTYRLLRIAMLVLVIMLATAVIYQIFRPEPDCWLGSISAYYYTSARAVFVVALCAIGACLVAYRGNTPSEDLALNVSGFLAFVVAFIPTPRGPGRPDRGAELRQQQQANPWPSLSLRWTTTSLRSWWHVLLRPLF